LKQAVERSPLTGVRFDPCLSGATFGLLAATCGELEAAANSMAPVKRLEGRILTAEAFMEYDVIEVRLEDAETVENQEVMELSSELLGQVGGGAGGVIL
jgi:hypothetical protein